MGALQALHVAGLIKYIDYLSTVSGGGYIGASMSAGMSGPPSPNSPAPPAHPTGPGTIGDPNEDRFPFQSRLDNQDTPSVRHIRDFSNYLMPDGVSDVIGNILIYLRGLIANAAIVVLWLLFFSATTILCNPTRSDLSKPWFGSLSNYVNLHHFVLSFYLSIIFVVLLFFWGVYQSVRADLSYSGTTSRFTRRVGYFGLGILGVAFVEAQPFVLDNIFSKFSASKSEGFEISGWIIGALGFVSITISILSNAIDRLLKATTDSDRLYQRLLAGVGQTAVVAAGAILPLLLWAAYLQLTLWGIVDPCHIWAPTLLLDMSAAVNGWLGLASFDPDRQVLIFYAAVFCFFFMTSCFDRPNIHSLHRLYRDRLSRAFLFYFVPADAVEPTLYARREVFVERVTGGEKLLALEPLDNLKLSQLGDTTAPYHLINTALNIQGSRHVNQRARNAEFFMLSKYYCGSEPTGYAATSALENISPHLNLATAMAVSGAAASANMGAKTNRLLTPTLTLLNIRLGMWLRNPNSLATTLGFKKAAKLAANFFNIYFFREMFGQLDEKSAFVYLTDGGHLENLGVYELLKRRCQIIIVVDAEADPEMNFLSLIKLQRHASIDLGVRIELPWRSIRETTLAVSKEMAADEGQGPVKARLGPHCAVGRVIYDDNHWGVIVYFKSSISGDENDYIIDYKRRNATFPHETTNDQFFTEEQFEVYRSLGFHVVNRVLAGEEAVPTHSGQNEIYEPIIKIWKGARFNDATVDKAKEIFRFAGGDAGDVLPLTDKVLPKPFEPKKRRGRKTAATSPN